MRGGSILAAAAVVGVLVGATIIARSGGGESAAGQPTTMATTATATPSHRPRPTPPSPTPPPTPRPIDKSAPRRITPVLQALMRAALPRADFLPSGFVAGPFELYQDPAGYLVAGANVRDSTGVGYVGLQIGWSGPTDPFEPCADQSKLTCAQVSARPGYRVVVMTPHDGLSIMVGASAPDGTMLMAYASRYAVDSPQVTSEAHRPQPALTPAQLVAVLTDPRLCLSSG
jgi:hypothetical protein